MENDESEIEQYEPTVLNDGSTEMKTLGIQVASHNKSIEKRIKTYDTAHESYREYAGKHKSKSNAVKKEELKCPLFKVGVIPCKEWRSMIESAVSDFQVDSQKKQLLLTKLSEEDCQLVKHHPTFKDIIMALQNHYGDELKAENDRILKFLEWAKGAPAQDIQKMSQDSSYLHGLVGGMIGLRKDKCACPNKTGCAQPNHAVDNHCDNHCLFDTFQADSNKSNSFLIAMAARKLPADIT